MSLATGTMLDVVSAIATVAADVANIRSLRGLPPLVCNTQSPVFPFYMGKESVRQETDAPRVVFIPRDIEVLPARDVGQQPPQGKVSQLPARPFGGRFSGTTSRYGAMTIRPASTHSSASTRLWNFTGSFSARSTGTSGARRTSASTARSGASRRTTSGAGGFSFSRSRGAATSPTSRTLSSHSPIPASRDRASRSTSPCRCSSRTAVRRSPASSIFPRSV